MSTSDYSYFSRKKGKMIHMKTRKDPPDPKKIKKLEEGLAAVIPTYLAAEEAYKKAFAAFKDAETTVGDIMFSLIIAKDLSDPAIVNCVRTVSGNESLRRVYMAVAQQIYSIRANLEEIDETQKRLMRRKSAQKRAKAKKAKKEAL